MSEHKCKYCGGERAWGSGCGHSPNHVHVHSGADYTACIYCGAERAWGTGCPHAPPDKNGRRIHRRQNGVGFCIWCGGKQRGSGCGHSPDHIHEW